MDGLNLEVTDMTVKSSRQLRSVLCYPEFFIGRFRFTDFSFGFSRIRIFELIWTLVIVTLIPHCKRSVASNSSSVCLHTFLNLHHQHSSHPLSLTCLPRSTVASLKNQSFQWSNHTRQSLARNPCQKWLKLEKRKEFSASLSSLSWYSFAASHFSTAARLWIHTWKQQIHQKCFFLASAHHARLWSANQISAMPNWILTNAPTEQPWTDAVSRKTHGPSPVSVTSAAQLLTVPRPF